MALDSRPEALVASRRFRGFGNRYAWAAMAFLWTLLALNHFMRDWTLGILQPAIVEEYGVDAGTIGLFVGLLTVAQGLLAIPLTIWSDRGGHGWARKRRYFIIVVAYSTFTILTAITPLTASFVALFAFQALNKMFSGPGEAIEVTSTSEWWSLEKRGFAVGFHHTAVPWGAFLGGLAVSVMFSWWGSENWRLVLLFPVILMIPTFILYWLFATKSRYERFETIVRRDGETPPLGIKDDEHIVAPRGAFGRALRNPNLMVSAILAGLSLAVYTGVTFWLPLYLAFVAGYSLAATAAFSVFFTLTGGLGQIFWGGISDRIGRKAALTISFVWMAVGLVLLQFSGAGIVALVLVQLFLGCATNGVYPVLYSFSSDSSERGAIGLGNGLNMTGQMLGGIGPIVVGALILAGGGFSNSTGFFWALYFLAGLMVLAAILVLLFTRETVGRFKHRDRALVSVERCIPDPLIRSKDAEPQLIP